MGGRVKDWRALQQQISALEKFCCNIDASLKAH